MDNSILYIIVAAIAGIILGKLDTVFTNKLKRGREEKTEQALLAKIERRDEEIRHLKGELAAPKPDKNSALSLAPHPSGVWTVEIDGQSVHPETIGTEQRARLISLLGHIRPLIEAKPVSRPTPAQPTESKQAQTPSTPAQPVAQPATPASVSSPNIPPSPLRANLMSGFRAMMDKKPEPAPGLVSIVALIDTILQKQLAETPLAKRQIRLEEGPTREVIVHVGATRYAGIDSVPDPEIQAVIRRAIEEFNKSQ